jgi:hypothetical protein
MSHHCGSPLGRDDQGAMGQGALGLSRGRRPSQGRLRVSSRSQRLGFPSLGEGHVVEVLPDPSTYINPPPWPPWLIHPSLQSSPLWLDSHIWSRACELEETPQAGRRRATRFLVQVLLLPLLRWTGAQTTSIYHTCVIPRRYRTCGTHLHRPIQLHDLEVGFGCPLRQRSCGNVPAHSVFKGMNTVATPLQCGTGP